ncbi:TPA: MFS transporter [Streptococcus equi subsp. zooepidemicus]|uniref:MFS transporter n=1 Tax=Streptococcus equi TaxID=1336 RepID=UPI001E35CF1F|nr:MFS transporter [Streptococcus equi]MCD3405978.1 MFS transporter [Streptococcus equi subsp. zooepidemicus]HEL0715612.1 MFS transporter [Streptococcus equi subsp. zooepidemicus]HEL1308568.1 MFS transporter [Streptococcus equi subsp. zooepidemicus]
MILRKYNDFCRLFLGRLISNCGDSIYTLVLSWYVLETTNSTWYVGLLNFLIFIPNTFSFIFGKKIDSYPKKNLLVILEWAQLLAVLGIILGMSLREIHASLSLTIIFSCVFLASMVGLNTYTVQDALVPKLIPTKDLAKAEMYMSVAYNGTDYVFTAISGFLLSVISYIPLLFIDIVTFLGSILFFRRIEFKEIIEQTNERTDFLSGLRFIWHNKVVLAITLGGAIANFLFAGLNVYQLLIAREVGDSTFYGLLVSASAIGTLVGTTFIANLVLQKLSVGKAFWLATALFGTGIGLTALVPNRFGLLLLWFLSCLFLGITHVTQKPILQTEIPDEHLGEVFSAFYTVTIPTLALGSLIFGFLANFLSWRLFVVLFAFSFILVSLLYFSNKTLRQYDIS